MVDGGGGAAFPVIFYDGVCEINIGNIRVQPMLEFKMFQKMIADGIGISPNQISIYIVHNSSSPGERRKIPITGKVNFSLIIGQKDSFFLVILKRSRRYRNRKLRPNGFDFGDFSSEGDFQPSPQPENVVLHRRNQPEFNLNVLQVDGYSKPLYQHIAQLGLGGLNDRLEDLMFQGNNYGRMIMVTPVSYTAPSLPLSGEANLNPNLDPGSFPRIEETMTKNVKESNKVACLECVKAEESGSPAPFHACVNDQRIELFRTLAGPISRPLNYFQ